MHKFNNNVTIEETSEYRIGELMNEVNNDIQVGDKVQWTQWRGDTPVTFTGRVESAGSFNGIKNFTITKFGGFPEDRTQTTMSISRVSKA